METNPKKQRQHFYRDYASGQWPMSERCDRYQVSRPTGYKWVDRIEVERLIVRWEELDAKKAQSAD